MAWSFTTDSDIQKELAKKLNTAADNFDNKVEAMYTQINNMGTYWIGEDYNMYKSGTEGYKPALENLAASLRMFSTHFDSVAEGTEQLASELATIILNMTGSSNAGNGTGGSGGGSTGAYNSDGGMTPSPDAVNGGDAGEGDGTTTPSSSGSGTSGNTSGGGTSGQTPGNPSGNKTSNDTVEVLNTEVGAKETYKSGDTISINGQTYNYYAGYQNPDGSVIHMVADNQGKLYYKDESGSLVSVKAVHMNGGGQYVESDATTESLGQKVNINVHGESIDMPVSLQVGDTRISKTDQLSSTVDVQGNSALGAEHIGTGSAYLDTGNTITSDGTLRESYNSGIFEGTKVNGSTFVKGTSMADFQNYLKPNDDGVVDVTIQIPQGASVQWDASSAPLNGYDFNTTNGPVYLRWDASAAGGQGAYKIVDQYGNFTANGKEFTLDGFNTDKGHWK